MRAALLLFTGWVSLLACGGKLVPSSDAGLPDLVDADPDADPDAEGGVAAAGYCIYQTCDGLSLCGAGKTCPVGDGCNSCTCTALSANLASSTCTNASCACP